MKNVLVPVADGSEEIEAVTTIDILRRAGANVTVASVMDYKTITASRGVKIEADTLLHETGAATWDMIVLPGGMPGAEHLHRSSELLDCLRTQFSRQGWVAAICAAPAVVLGRHRLITDYNATCFPAFQKEMESQCLQVLQDKVVINRNLITSQGPGTAVNFALAAVRVLYGENNAREVAQALVFTENPV